MTWSKERFPKVLRRLHQQVRDRAIENGNAMMEEQKEMEESILIASHF